MPLPAWFESWSALRRRLKTETEEEKRRRVVLQAWIGGMGVGMSRVLPDLFVGSLRDSRDERALQENQISHVVSVHDSAKPWRRDLTYLCIVASDSPSVCIVNEVPGANDFIHEARQGGGKVLVHCLAGMSRSVSLVVAYLMTVSDLNFRESMNVVQGARRQANPNFGFRMQLKDFETAGLASERARFRKKFPLEADGTVQGMEEEFHKLQSQFSRWIYDGPSPLSQLALNLHSEETSPNPESQSHND